MRVLKEHSRRLYRGAVTEEIDIYIYEKVSLFEALACVTRSRKYVQVSQRAKLDIIYEKKASSTPKE